MKANVCKIAKSSPIFGANMRETQTINLFSIGWKKGLAFFLQILISICALVYIVYRLRQEAFDWLSLWESIGPFEILLTGISLALVPVNWGLEAFKWKLAVKGIYPEYKFSQAFKGVVTGIATGIFTPNRVGDYAGRLLYLKPGKRWEAGVILMVDRLCQLVITLWVGIYSVSYLILYDPQKLDALIPYGNAKNYLLLALGLFSITLPLALVFIGRIKLPEFLADKWNKYLQLLNKSFLILPPKRVLSMLGIGFIRYLSFSLQYYLLMRAFGFTESLGVAFLLIGLVFLVKTVLPYISVTELGLRESVAILVMGIWAVPVHTAISSTFFLYVINLILPAIVGVALLNIKRG